MPLFGPREPHNDADADLQRSEIDIEASSNSTTPFLDHVSTADNTKQNESAAVLSISKPDAQASPISPYLSPPIALIVGGPQSHKQQTFYVHADLLTSLSPFFRAAFDNHDDQTGFAESTTLTMRLPEERPEDVAFLLEWLYMKALRGVNDAAALYHDLIDIPLQNMEKYKRERAVVQAAERHGDVSQLVIERPKPPAFGPLIRLHILADCLNIDWKT
jgi:BTB/POZ domain